MGTFDKYLNAKVWIPRGGRKEYGQVIERKRDRDHRPIGTQHSNPLLDTSVYGVQFADGSVEEYTANIVAENIYAQVDDAGNTLHMVDDFIGHKKDETAVPIEDGYYRYKGTERRRETTRGWQINVLWKDGTTTWMDLKDIKDAEPIRLAKYAKDNDLLKEPAFAWWCHHVLKKRDRSSRP